MTLPQTNEVECPTCHGRLLNVNNRRTTKWEDLRVIRRHRVCADCNKVHTTIEVSETGLKEYRKKRAMEIVTKLVSGDF